MSSPATGNPVQPAITVPPDATNLSVGTDGTVSVVQPGQTASSQVGSMQLALFINPGGLNSVGNNIYLPTTASGDPHRRNAWRGRWSWHDPAGHARAVERQRVDQFVQMIVAQRTYESNSRVVKAADEMLQQLNQLAQ